MEFYRLFSFPNEFNTVLEILEYIFCKMLWQPTFIPDFLQIYVTESNEPKRHIFYKIENDIIYTPLPGFWDVTFKSPDNPKWEGCPSRLDHEMLDLLKNISNYAQTREIVSAPFHQLRILFQQFEKENPLPCSFCRLREYEMKELNIPLLYLNDFYIGFRECSLEKLQEIIKKHVEYCQIITKQSRSPEIQKNLLQIIQSVYYEQKIQYEEAIFNHDLLDPITDQFKRKLENNLLKLLPFLTFKNIDFEQWFKSIFLFQLELKENVSESLIQRQSLCKKILFLLFHLFPESLSDLKQKQVPCKLYHKKKKEPFIFSTPSHALYAFHPILRGAVIKKN